MSKHALKMPDTEQERQQLLNELLADHGPHWAEQYEPGSFGCHELLDRTALAADVVERYVRTHPACIQNQEWLPWRNKRWQPYRSCTNGLVRFISTRSN
jgi:hypothetical protein